MLFRSGFARIVVAALAAQLDPTVEEITDVKTAVSEAVTNCIIHGYEGKEDEKIQIEAELIDKTIKIVITDFGKGIKDINRAMEPLYTSKPEEERSGMGFTVMESFMDTLEVESKENKGTKVMLCKTFNSIS